MGAVKEVKEKLAQNNEKSCMHAVSHRKIDDKR